MQNTAVKIRQPVPISSLVPSVHGNEHVARDARTPAAEPTLVKCDV